MSNVCLLIIFTIDFVAWNFKLSCLLHSISFAIKYQSALQKEKVSKNTVMVMKYETLRKFKDF